MPTYSMIRITNKSIFTIKYLNYTEITVGNISLNKRRFKKIRQKKNKLGRNVF